MIVLSKSNCSLFYKISAIVYLTLMLTTMGCHRDGIKDIVKSACSNGEYSSRYVQSLKEIRIAGNDIVVLQNLLESKDHCEVLTACTLLETYIDGYASIDTIAYLQKHQAELDNPAIDGWAGRSKKP